MELKIEKFTNPDVDKRGEVCYYICRSEWNAFVLCVHLASRCVVRHSAQSDAVRFP